VLGIQAGLDTLGQLDLVGCRQQRHLADLVEIYPDQVCGGRCLVQVGERRAACGRYPVIAGVRLDDKRYGVRGVERVGKAVPGIDEAVRRTGPLSNLGLGRLGRGALGDAGTIGTLVRLLLVVAGWQIGIDNLPPRPRQGEAQ
jgi:hypothetical protein